METTTYLCIGCPLGCRLEVDEDETGDIVEIRGYSCKRGKTYAEQEHVAPQRMVTTTVEIAGGRLARLPVKSSAPVPKDLVVDICRALRRVHVLAPIQMGDVIATNVLNTGADVIATRDMPVLESSS